MAGIKTTGPSGNRFSASVVYRIARKLADRRPHIFLNLALCSILLTAHHRLWRYLTACTFIDSTIYRFDIIRSWPGLWHSQLQVPYIWQGIFLRTSIPKSHLKLTMPFFTNASNVHFHGQTTQNDIAGNMHNTYNNSGDYIPTKNYRFTSTTNTNSNNSTDNSKNIGTLTGKSTKTYSTYYYTVINWVEPGGKGGDVGAGDSNTGGAGGDISF